MNCVICEKIKEKQAIVVYEDDSLVAILPSKPAVIGHVRIIPKEHYTKLDQIPENLSDLLLAFSSFSSSAVFDLLGAQGTNILLNESENHLMIDVIPRKENDGLNFTWKPKPASPDDLDSVFSKIKDKAFVVGKSNPQKLQQAPVIEIKTPPAKAKIEVSDLARTVESSEEKPKSINESEGSSKAPGIKRKEPESYLIKQLRKIP